MVHNPHMPNKLAPVLARIERLIRKASVSPEPLQTGPITEPMAMMSKRDVGSLTLVGVDAVEYFGCVDDLCAAVPHAEEFSRGAVSEFLQLCLLEAVGSNVSTSVIKANLSRLQAKLGQRGTSWTILLPIAGATLQGRSVDFGRAIFRSRSKHFQRRLQKACSPQRGTSGIRAFIASSVADGLRHQVFAEFRVSAYDQKAAVERAEKELALTLDVLNTFGDLLEQNFDLRPIVTEPGERDGSDATGFAITGSYGTPLSRRLGRRLAFDLTKLRKKGGLKQAISRASALLKDPSPGPMTQRVLTSLRLAGRASIATRYDESILLFVMALESLLLAPDRSSEMSYRLRVRASHLLSSPGRRALAAKEINALYGLRSAIAHTGTTAISLKDVKRARLVTKIALLEVLRGKHFMRVKNNSLDSWLDDRILGD